jgi:hypothetical protein
MPKPEQALTGASIPEYIEIKTATGDTVAFLSPRSDGIDECWISDEQNGSCTLEFTLPIIDIATEQTSRTATVKGVSGEATTLAAEDKWQYLTDQYRIYAGDKEFVIHNPDAIDRQREGKKLTGKIKAHESWVLLGKKFQTISNDPQNQSPPWSAVIILSGGAPKGGFAQGSAGGALSWLLEGTGWTVGTVDVTGTYDLETEKESVLANINAIQQKWGGILVWDSINKTVSLRDEETWKNYTGYQIRYAKNLKGITRTDDYDIVTRLYPFGENDLNIANVNGGSLYLDNQSYSAEILEGVWYNQELTDQNQLKAQAEKQLAAMCSPRHNYKTEILDLRSLPGYGHETFARSDVVDLCDEDLGTNEQVRIIRRRHNVFQPWLCDLELGDPLEKISATVAQTILMAKFYKNVVKPNESFQNLLKALINTKATEINGASGDYTLVDGVSTWFDRDDVTGELTGKLVRITPQGFIISYDGGQTWKLAISGEGIHADAGWVGKLNAGVVTVGAGTTFEAGYNPSAKNANYVQDTDPSANWTGIENIYHINDTWYSQAEQKTRIFKNNEAYFFNLGVGGGSVISGYAGSAFSTLGRPVPVSYFGIKGATAGIGNLYLWKLDSAFKFVELVATGNAVYEDGGANYHCELTLEANTNYAIIASVMYGNISRINGSSVISNDYVTGVLDKNYAEISAPTAGAELTTAMEHEIRLGIYGWVEVEDQVALNAQAAITNHAAESSPHNLPSFVQLTEDGVKVFDASPESPILRVMLGEYANSKFGLKVYNGDIAIDNASGLSRIILNPDDGFKIQKLVNSAWADVLSEDANGNIVMSGKLAAGSIISDASITGGSINIGNGNFKVTSAGILTATGANISGTINAEDIKIDGESIVVNNQIDSSYISDFSADRIATGTLTGIELVGNTIKTAASGSRIEISGTSLRSLNSSGQWHGAVISAASTSYYLAIYNAGSPLGLLGINTDDGTRLWLKSEIGYKLKIQSGDDMSITVPSGKKCYFMGGMDFGGATVTGITATAVFG